MQRTRLNTLVDGTGTRIERFFDNPWRRFSLILIGLLFGFFAGAGISTTAGQAAEWDIVGAGLILFFTELVSRFVYAQNRRSLFVDILNFFKIGVIYSLFLEAFKLGS
jgi:hypothetical protein